MLDISKYQKIEAIQELQTDYKIMIATLNAEINLKEERIRGVEEKLRMNKPADVKLFGYLRLMTFKKAIHLAEIKKLTYMHYQDGLHDKMKELT